METNKIYQGDALEVLKTFPDESINCVMTSPPYWALRDYGIKEQLGLEKTFDEYINKLCDIFDEVKRVLRDDGTCWVNIGDTYGGSGNSSGHNENTKNLGYTTSKMGASKGNQSLTKQYAKSLVMIPMRFAIEMVNRGWILRNTIIWHKRNCMPSSVKDRFTVDFEYLYFFVKNKKYWFETQYEPTAISTITRGQYGWKGREIEGIGRNQPQATEKMGDRWCNPSGRNKRAVWTITTKPFKEAHFATYPEELCYTPIKAGCPEFVCNKCGKARYPIYKSQFKQHSVGATSGQYWEVRNFKGSNTVVNSTIQEGLTDCNCNAGFSGGIVLDPFFGAGTTGLVALKQNKKFIGIELNPKYIEIAEKRLKPYLEQRKL